MATYIGYDPRKIICSIHNVNFVRFECAYGNRDTYYQYSHGCPICVETIRNEVKPLIAKRLRPKLRNLKAIWTRRMEQEIREYDQKKIKRALEVIERKSYNGDAII